MKEKTDINPMQRARRCEARSKRTGEPCKAPAVKGWAVCRMHGAYGGAPEGKRNGNYVHGTRTKGAKDSLALVKALAKVCRETVG